MSAKPAIRRTYGKAPPRTTSSSSLFDSPSPPPFIKSTIRSSSPPSSSRIETPGPSSSPSPFKINGLHSRSSSPLFWSADEDEDEERENGKKIASSSKLPPTPSPTSANPDRIRPSKISSKSNVKPKQAIQSSLKGFFTPQPHLKRKADPRSTPLEPAKTVTAPGKSSKISDPVSTSVLGVKRPWNTKAKTPSKPFTQLHLTHLPLVHTCSECGMSFMRGGDDEGIHVAHHTRVLRGIIWDGLGRSSKSNLDEKGWKVVRDDIVFGVDKKGKGKVIMVDGNHTGTKLDEIVSTVDRVLSSPPLPPAIMQRCKIFLFVTSSPPPLSKSSVAKKRQKLDTAISKKVVQKERVIGVVVAQGIKWAMRVLSDGEVQNKPKGKVVIESGGFGSVTCDPESLSTPLGIHRLYISPSYRSNNLSVHLLDAACSDTVYGCHFDPLKGEVAFSQPTQSGRTIMEKWGKGHVRVFVDDESQL
uniref:N-acetyltransferase ESCO acetyl-transferase domain-containing protein n=1 Tax=Kwoniella dejecticola CBS 10117 TaxID=1296121 RepID=A0A1A6A9J6_9TREE|nr:uncharacterized protein I303_02731 [Kwoniella dejecticola CBS 10117]OBR86719.1 hypothetical protein I303_02731 [Kwoniella dejecticola CBS 10117]